MTVQELVVRLNRLNQEAEVLTYASDPHGLPYQLAAADLHTSADGKRVVIHPEDIEYLGLVLNDLG